MKRIGFTGTRDGMTVAQKDTVWELLRYNKVSEVHHGDCVGADADFHTICRGRYRVVIHPPQNPKLRACCLGDVTLPTYPYLDRNRHIVDATDWLIATPKEAREAKKGGTWFTVHYARQQGKQVTIVWPDGSTHNDGKVSGP